MVHPRASSAGFEGRWVPRLYLRRRRCSAVHDGPTLASVANERIGPLTRARQHDRLPLAAGTSAAINTLGVNYVHRFLVSVRNDCTGEIRTVEVQSTHGADAQVEALHQLFKQEDWRRATAMQPESVEIAS